MTTTTLHTTTVQQALIDYMLHLADNALIICQRNAAWCGHGPALEQDIALTNISLDLIGQSRNLYQYATTLINEKNGVAVETEDSLAFLRTERAFKNCLLTEQPNGDWAQTILRQFLFSTYQYVLFDELKNVADKTFASIALKSLKEIAYHVKWSAEWAIRLGDGTEESHQRMEDALQNLWPYTAELFEPVSYESMLQDASILPKTNNIQQRWNERIAKVMEEATLTIPANMFMQYGGKTGLHTEHMGYLLSELQYMQRTYPGCEW